VSAPEILPDCRAKEGHGAIPSLMGYWVPVFCANCGKEGPAVTEGATFLFWLCNTCATTHGQIAGTMLMPDEVYFEQVKQEQIASYGRYLTVEELSAVVEADASPLATLLKQGRALSGG